MFQHLTSREDLKRLRDELLEGSRADEATLDQALAETLPEKRMELLNRTQARAIGRLRLAARVQEHIWEWEKVALLEGKKVTEEELTAAESEMPVGPVATGAVDEQVALE